MAAPGNRKRVSADDMKSIAALSKPHPAASAKGACKGGGQMTVPVPKQPAKATAAMHPPPPWGT